MQPPTKNKRNGIASYFLLLLLTTTTTNAFPISSSSSSQKPKRGFGNTPKGNTGGGSGFGKAQNQVPTTHTIDTSPTTTNLINFLLSQKSKGIGSNSNTEVGISNENGATGLYASKPFKKGEIICQIPSDCCLALSDPALGGGDSPTLAHNGRNFIEFYIRNAQNNMMWSPYLDTLPSSSTFPEAGTTPDFFTKEEIAQLEFPRAIQYVEQRLEDLKLVSEKYGYDYEELQYATWIASTRSFAIQLSDDSSEETTTPEGELSSSTVAKPSKSIRVLVPYIDLATHSSNNANVELHLIDPEKDEAWFALRATRPIKQGKELCRSFGNGVESTVELFCNYGFVPEENKIDSFMLKKSGEKEGGGVLKSLEDWSSTLEEDEKALEGMEEGHLKDILRFRIQLKRSYE